MPIKAALGYFLFFIVAAYRCEASSIEEYVNLLNRSSEFVGPDGDIGKQEIAIVRDPVKIREIEQRTGREAGVIYQDRYWTWLNDPVQFPNGTYGVYGRMIWTHALKGPSGVAVLPVLSDGRVVLNRMFRHATRSWEFELPRGGVDEGETFVEAVIRETKEETGLVIDEVIFLGNMAPDSGMISAIVPIYLARVKLQEESKPEDSEAIAGIHAFTVEELRRGFREGYISIDLEGRQVNIPLRDPFLAFALLQMDIRKINIE